MAHFPNFWGKRNFSKQSGFAKRNFIWVSSLISNLEKTNNSIPRKNVQADRRIKGRNDWRTYRPYFRRPFQLKLSIQKAKRKSLPFLPRWLGKKKKLCSPSTCKYLKEIHFNNWILIKNSTTMRKYVSIMWGGRYGIGLRIRIVGTNSLMPGGVKGFQKLLKNWGLEFFKN